MQNNNDSDYEGHDIVLERYIRSIKESPITENIGTQPYPDIRIWTIFKIDTNQTNVFNTSAEYIRDDIGDK